MAARPPLVVIVGPTAVGKTALSLRLAEALHGEIVSADSRQVYVGMNIGTAKPTAAERARVPHHMLDVLAPDQTLSVAEYQAMAYAAIAAIHDRQHLPLLVGGSGQYVRAVVEGWQVPAVTPDWALRTSLAAEANANGAQVLHARLQGIDPVAAAHIDARNVRRVIRALEVYAITGQPISQLQQRHAPPYRIVQVGLTLPADELYRRIDQRIAAMLDAGLVQEVQTLLAAGYSPTLPAMTGLGYREIGRFVRGEQNLDEAVIDLKRATRRFVRQQRNWFRQDDSHIRWYQAQPDPSATILDMIQRWLDAPPAESSFDDGGVVTTGEKGS
jgi:tRNA dimethylallyltransferase